MHDRVLWLLENYPMTRNDDVYLWILYIRFFHPRGSRYIKWIPGDEIKRMPRPESIRRARQYIQNTLGLYPPTDPKVIKRRRRAEEAYRRKYGRRPHP